MADLSCVIFGRDIITAYEGLLLQCGFVCFYGLRVWLRQKGAIVVLDLTYGNSDDVSGYYTVYPVTYEQLIRLADDYLAGYEPDERVKEKYSLG